MKQTEDKEIQSQAKQLQSKKSKTSGFDEARILEALVREKGLSLEDARVVVSGVKEEIEALSIKEQLPEKTLKELVESKLKEYELSRGLKPRTEEFFDDEPLTLSENALRVLAKRYLKKDHQGKPVESAQDLFHRVARAVARADLIYDPDADIKSTEKQFYQIMARTEFMPNSPTLMNADRELGQLSACFVLPVEDSLDSIFEAVKYTALIHKSGGGTGFSFSKLRPKNDMVSSTKGVASGPISFMKVFDAATEEIKQGGTRRGANMGILRVDHPDIKDFICAKENNSMLNNFNLSVALTEEFMSALERDGTYFTLNPRTKEKVEEIKAKEVFDLIVEHAWKNGEPGIVFIDRINRDNPTPSLGEIESTNPCGEQPLLPYESCNLGSINLGKMVVNGEINWSRLKEVVHIAVHFLDNVIDINKYPIPKIEEMTKLNRKIGLGVMGFADMLFQLNIPYNSERALDVAGKIMKFIQEEGRRASAELAKTRGPFPSYEQSIYAKNGTPPLRNATITTIAPTGTISIIAGASSGIEPIFALAYIRNVMDNDELIEVNTYFEKVAKERGFYSEELMRKIVKVGSIQKLDEIPEDVKKVFVTALDISPEWHIRMQAEFQKYTDNAVSKTVNFPEDATKEDVAKAYKLAYKLGCKGVTVYRYGSREAQVLNIGEVNRKAEEREKAAKEHRLEPRPRPDVVKGMTRKMPTGCGSLYVTINEDEEGLFEVFTNMGKAGGCSASQAEAISRLISLALRAGIKTEEIVKQIKNISCPMMTWWQGEKILSCADAIAKAIEQYPSYMKNGSTPIQEKKSQEQKPEQSSTLHPQEASPRMALCPECKGTVEYKEGCLTCPICGYTKCL